MTGTVVVSMSAGRVGVAVSAGVVVSIGTQQESRSPWNNTQTLDGCEEDALIIKCLFKVRFFIWNSSSGPGNTGRRGNDKRQIRVTYIVFTHF